MKPTLRAVERARVARVVKRINQIRRLLKEFGATLSAYDPGVLAYLSHPTVTLDFGSSVWNWLEPLLIELRNARRAAAKRRSRQK